MLPDGSAAQQMTHSGAFYAPARRPVGKWLYSTVPNVKGAWKMTADGGEPTKVRATFFDITGSGIFDIGERQADGYPLVLYPFGERKLRTLGTLSRRPCSVEVSPDGRWFLYTIAEAPTCEIPLVDKFR